MTLHVGQGMTVGALTVFPVWNDRGGRRRYETGVDRLEVAEVEGGSVPRLRAVNPGLKDVLVLDGELFEGGWQHRMATRSSIVPARAAADLDVACVEEHRWGSGERRQVTRGRRASTYVRHGFDRGGQREVWRRVAAAGGGSSATGSYVEHRNRVEDQLGRRLARIRPLPGQSGVLVGVAGHPLALEVFDDPRTLVEQFDAIIRAAGLDAAGQPPVATPGRRARRLVERLERIRLRGERDGHGLSRLVRQATDRYDVMALGYQQRVVHLRVTNRQHPALEAA